MFMFVKEKPELLWREFFPDEVVAAAAVVAAASLPGGQQFDQKLEALVEHDLVSDVRLAAPAPDLASAALQALTFVAGPGGPWHQGWTNDTNAAEARETVAVLSQVLAIDGGATE
jgi:hypothetical protein